MCASVGAFTVFLFTVLDTEAGLPVVAFEVVPLSVAEACGCWETALLPLHDR